MSIVELFILAVGLSMDAFAVSICKGLSLGKIKPKHMCIAGAWFGGFQALMPLIGYYLGSLFADMVTRYSHWVAFALLLAIGGNMNAAKLSGVRTQRVQLMVYVMSSICAWMVGLILAARISSGQPTAGESYEMDAIAATAIGGTSMSGGIGSLSGTIIGFVILGLLQNSMNLMNINSFWQQIVKGLLIIIAVFLDMRTKGKKA